VIQEAHCFGTMRVVDHRQHGRPETDRDVMDVVGRGEAVRQGILGGNTVQRAQEDAEGPAMAGSGCGNRLSRNERMPHDQRILVQDARDRDRERELRCEPRHEPAFTPQTPGHRGTARSAIEPASVDELGDAVPALVERDFLSSQHVTFRRPQYGTVAGGSTIWSRI
jgi:hypothetical protein